MRIISKDLVNIATVTASSSEIYLPVTNIQNSLRSKPWRSTSKTDQWVMIDLGSAQDVDSVIILLPINGHKIYSGNQTIKIQANDADSWDSPSIDQALTLSGFDQLTHYFSTAVSYRYWRVTLTDSSALTDYLEIGKVILGKSESVQNCENGFKVEYIDNTKLQKNDFGNVYADLYPTLRRFSMNYNALTTDTVDKLADIFLDHGNHTPLFMVLDETDTVLDKDRYSIYGLITNNFVQNHRSYDIFNGDGYSILELN